METDMYRLPPGLITPRAGVLTGHGRLARNLVNSSCKPDEPGRFSQAVRIASVNGPERVTPAIIIEA
jgi:hypothetical protein